MDDVDLESKIILLRIDINAPYDPKSGTIYDSERIRAHAQTIKELSDKSAKVVVLAHQGRRGDLDFIPLNQHAVLLSKHTGKPIIYVDDVVGEKAVKAINKLEEGEVLLLDNVRFLEDETIKRNAEEHAESNIVRSLSPLADLFVNDAFSVAHRSHASIVGFTARLLSAAGRVMERETESCEKALKPERPNIFVLGGAKPDDCVEIMEHMFKKGVLDKALTCGLLGQLFLEAHGVDLGQASREFLKKKGFLNLVPTLKDLGNEYSDRIEYPLDVAEEVDGARVERSLDELPCRGLIMDIGVKTVDRYRESLKNAKSIVVKGPAGVYEKKGFDVGTRLLLEEIKKSKGYTLIGGGDTSSAISRLSFKPEDFSSVSIAGGALITYLSGKDIPGVKALREAAKHRR
jgi:phosphoglycerate kinase